MPVADFKNDPADKFCGGCGRPLDDAPAAVEQQGHALPERRPVAVLIADLANFTRLSAGRDPEDTQRLLARYFEAVDPIVLQHGGTIDKHIGDAMMALFGAPIAHGDDALRAARAAIAIHRMAELSRESGEPSARISASRSAKCWLDISAAPATRPIP